MHKVLQTRAPVLEGEVERAVVHLSHRLGRGLNLKIAIASQTRTSRNQLTEDDVLLQTEQRIRLVVHRSFSQNLGRLLEGGGRQP